MDWKVNDEPEILVRDATYGDALLMGGSLRESDCREIAALSDESPTQALVTSYLSSPGRCYTVTMDGMPVLMAGCAVHPSEPGIGVPWLLGTDLIYKRPFPSVMLAHGHEVLAKLTEGFDRLINLTADLDHQEWLRGLGFVLVPHEHPGRNGEPLLVFAKENTPCASPHSPSPPSPL